MIVRAWNHHSCLPMQHWQRLKKKIIWKLLCVQKIVINGVYEHVEFFFIQIYKIYAINCIQFCDINNSLFAMKVIYFVYSYQQAAMAVYDLSELSKKS